MGYLACQLVYLMINHSCLICFLNPFTVRDETGELRVGVRKAMRHSVNVPSSVISSHSMHIAVLATAWHAVKSNTMFIVYYKPRCVIFPYIHIGAN